MTKIKKIQHPYAWEILQARIDESIVTGQPLVEKPYWFENLETGQLYYGIYGCVGWPTEVSDKDAGQAGYVAVVGVIKPKKEDQLIMDANFQLLAEGESRDIEVMLHMIVELRNEWGFGQHDGLMQTWIGDHERYVPVIARRNERLILAAQHSGKKIDPEKFGILISPPDDFGGPNTFDDYHRAMSSALRAGHTRFYFGGLSLLRGKLQEFKADNPAVFAMGGLIHSLINRTTWMDQAGTNIFHLEED